MTRRLTGVEGPHENVRLVVGGAPAAAAEVAVVLLHGRGGTPEGLLRLADEFYRSGVALIAPEARRSIWFPARHDAPIEDNEPALSSAVDCAAAAVKVADEVGVPPERTLLVGVSQGGCVASEFLRRRPRRYGGAFVVSAALPGPDLVPKAPGVTLLEVDGDLEGTPVELASSEDDPHVSPERVRATAEILERGGATVDVRIDTGSGHGLSDATSVRIGDRLSVLLGPSGPSSSV